MEANRFPGGHGLVDHFVAAGCSCQPAGDARADGGAESGGGLCGGDLFVWVDPGAGSFQGATPPDQLAGGVWVQLATPFVGIVNGDGCHVDHSTGGLGFGNIIDQTHGPVPRGGGPATVRANVANGHLAGPGDFPGPPGHCHRPSD